MSSFGPSYRMGQSLPAQSMLSPTIQSASQSASQYIEKRESVGVPLLASPNNIMSSSPKPMSVKRMAKALDQHLGTSPGGMTTAAGSIMYDLVKYAENLHHRSSPKLHTRRKSEPAVPPLPKTVKQPQITTIGFDTDSFAGRPPSPPSPDLTVRQLLAPGGFRRHYVTEEARRENRDPPLTRNFAEFLALHSLLHGLDSDDDEDVDFPEREVFYRMDETGTRVLRRFVSGHFPTGHELVLNHEDGEVISPSRMSHSIFAAEAKETDPLLEIAGKPEAVGSSFSQTYFLLLKAFVGTGILFLPSAFADVGFTGGIVGLILMSIVCSHCMLLLFHASRQIPMPSPGYGDVAEVLLGPAFRSIVQASVALSQCGFASSYLIFASQNVQSVMSHFLGHQVPLSQVMLPLTLALVPMVWIRNLSSLYSFVITLIANLFIFIAICYLGVRDVESIVEDGPAWRNGAGFSFGLGPSPATFIGTALFAFEGSAMVLPVSNAMQDSRQFPKVLMLSLASILVLMLFVGTITYIAFGDKVETIVFLNMPANDPLVRIVMILYATAVFLSYPLCIFPAVRIIESWIFGLKAGKHKASVKWSKNAFRSVLVLVLGVVAYKSSSRLDLFVSLLGSVLIIPMGYVYPSLFSLQLGRLTAASWWMQGKNVLLVVFGMTASVFITIQNIRQWCA